MNSSNALVVRNQATPTTRTAATQRPKAALSERLAEAEAISRAGDLIPKEYRNNPGAVMLAMNWADTHEVDLFGTMGNVAFFGGKATVSADMQRDLAGRMGFYTRVTDESAEPGAEHCTVTVLDASGAPLGSYTFTHEMAKGLDAYNRNKNYQKDLGEMLLARATTRALKRYASGPGLASILAEPQEQTEPVEVLEQAAQAEPVTTIKTLIDQYGLNVEAATATRAHAMTIADDLDRLTDDQAASLSAWIEAQLEAG